MNTSRASHTRRQSTLWPGAAIAAVSLLAAVPVELSLKFYSEFSWLWSIVIGLAVLFVMGLLATLLKVVSTRCLENAVTWVFGNLPQLDLRSRAASSQTATRPSGRHARSMPPGWREALSVQINNQNFSLADLFEADKLFLTNFEEGGTVARVRADALPGQTMLMAKQCVARSFGGEFVVAPLTKGEIPSVRADTTAFLFFARPDHARPLAPRGIERITIVAAGGWNALAQHGRGNLAV